MIVVLVALSNLVLGVAYTGYGMMTAIEMKRDWRTFGFSHFGAAWICMAFTCGPHHLDHGLHVARRPPRRSPRPPGGGGRPAGRRAVAVAAGRGLPGRAGRPLHPRRSRWLRAAPTASGAVCRRSGRRLWSASSWPGPGSSPGFAVWANVILVGLYIAVGWFVLRTQLANRPSMGGWSVSGLSLSVIFPTCALMHAVWAAYAVAGRYHQDGHGLLIDWLSVPAGIYFLPVVRGLYRDSLRDWNDGPDEVPTESLTPHPQTGLLPPKNPRSGPR